MTDFEKAEPTNELRWVMVPMVGPNKLDTSYERRLQQKWNITQGRAGRVEYSEVWRLVPTVMYSKEGDQS